ncbi:MAG: ATP-binding protein [Desulfovibrio sp.]
MSEQGKGFLVNTSPNKRLVVDGLTRDLSTEACIFDLIDNSVDAARETILKRLAASGAQEEATQPFAGFIIKLKLGSEGLVIEDNCGGIPVAELKALVLRFGQPSRHISGIGAFGIGLNRALFKLGRVSRIKTDTGVERAELLLDVEEYLKDDKNWNLPALEFPSSGEAGTTIEISGPNDEISLSFSGDHFGKELRKSIGQRYGRFIRLGLIIEVNGDNVQNGEILIRENGPFPIEYKFLKLECGVSILIECGQHILHRFTAEQDYTPEGNIPLTKEYGWSILCNDRAIILFDRTPKTGWDTRFHTEFYGFVGNVNFQCDDPSLLPWNTAKTDVDLNNKAYQFALRAMREFTEKWRQFANKAKTVKKKGEHLSSVPPAPAQQTQNVSTSAAPKPHQAAAARPTPAAKAPAKQKPIIKPTIKEDHNQFRTILPGDVDEKHCDEKHLALVHEAKRLDLATLSYSGLALIRIIYESSVMAYCIRHKIVEDLNTYCIAMREKGIKRSLLAPEKKTFIPKMEEMSSFLENNPDSWDATKATYIKRSQQRMSHHMAILNGVMHNPFQPINRLEAMQIRDEILPVLRHLIEQ